MTIKDEPLCNEIKLREKASFAIGVAINTNKLKDNETYRNKVIEQFNSFTPEKALKPLYVHPEKGNFNFTEADHLIEYCRYYKIRLHGHTLVWHKALPHWMEKFKGNANEWDMMLKEHIQGIIYHCKDYIKSWDVVNEAFNDDGTLRKNIWLKNMGESYIEKAFRYAMEADPEAKLFYNDYSLEHGGEKLDAVLRFFSDLKAKGIRIDGIGLQMHVSLEYPTIDHINGAALKIQNNGFIVHYSELDVALNDEQNFFKSGKRLTALQKNRMKEIVKGFMKLKPENRFGITLWGLSDADSWLSEDSFRARPLLYDKHYKIKPAYCGFVEGLE
jgi:endo-1,4-beta-xylanase